VFCEGISLHLSNHKCCACVPAVITYLLSKMLDELMISSVVSVGVAAYVFWGLGLTGNFALFWLSYFVTLCNGIGELSSGCRGGRSAGRQ
jgi:hypothetical protein